jgi:hypothetical protein
MAYSTTYGSFACHNDLLLCNDSTAVPSVQNNAFGLETGLFRPTLLDRVHQHCFDDRRYVEISSTMIFKVVFLSII